MVGRTISHYRITGQLGAGGMGIVYAAEDVRLGRPVALKLVQEDFAKDPTVIERLRAEARAASALNHPNICTIYDVGEYDGQPFIVMELLKGQTMRNRLAHGPLRIPELIDIGIQVADALDAAHRQSILHRDIKPANLFLVDTGAVKIVDFGVAKRLTQQASSSGTVTATQDLITTQGLIVGTVAYMSPEQVSGDLLDGRTDVFSLGVVLYECATGHQPFAGKTPGLTLAAILHQTPVAPRALNAEIPIRLQEVMNNCLEKDRELRYPDAAGLRADLKRIRRDLESGQSQSLRVPAAPPPVEGVVSSRESQQTRTRRWTMLPILAVPVTMAALIVAWIWMWDRSPSTPQALPATTSTEPVTDAATRNVIDLAAASLRAADYRAALQYSEDALTRAPDDIEAARIRQEARAALDRFDEALARARRLFAAGDFDGAAAAVAVASTLDSRSAAVIELSQRLAQQRAQNTKPTPSSPRTSALAAPDQTPAAPAPQPPAVADGTALGTTSGGVPSTSTVPFVPVQPRPTPQEPVAVNGQPPAPVPEIPEEPTQPARPAEPTRPRDEAPASRGRGAAQNPTVDDDEVIRRVIDAWAQAIERKDLAAYRAVKPNLSADEVRRIQEGFRAVSSQRVMITILGIDHRGQNAAVVRLRRRDTIAAGGRQQTTDIEQTMTLARSGAGWVISEIGR